MESWEAGLWPSSRLSLQTSPVILNSNFPLPSSLSTSLLILGNHALLDKHSLRDQTSYCIISTKFKVKELGNTGRAWKRKVCQELGQAGWEGTLKLDPANKDECVCTKAWRSPPTTHRQATKPL